MLSLLRIRNLAIIDELELEPGPGLNILTGETGAGKSMLIAALKLVLGGRGRPELVRTGAACAEVEALFDLSRAPRSRERLLAEGVELEDSGELVIRRVVTAAGRSRAYLNGSLCPASQLERLARGLVDISSQHQHHSLVDPASHLGWLDAYGGLLGEVAAVEEAWLAAATAERRLKEAETALRERADREDLLRMQLAEIDEANPVAGELEDLEANLGKARHAARLIAATRGAEQALYGADGSVVEQLATIAARLLDGVRVDPALEDHRRRVEGARLELVEVARDLERYGSRSALDPRRAGELEERLHLLKRLSRRHGGDLSGLLAWREEARTELAELSQGEARVEQLSAEARRARGILGERARALSVRRAGVAARLSAGITGELRGLGMENARLDVVLEPLSAGIDVDGLRVGPKGADGASFRIAPNPGEVARPLAQIASGGELSRTLLALKRVLVGLGDVGLYVFDEVDTGVGGGIAEVIGQRLAEVGAHHQALCITHSPQVAAYGDSHFHVSKAIRDGRTFSQIHNLKGTDRQVELARMVGGLELTAATHAAAGDLLRGARRARREAGVNLRAAG